MLESAACLVLGLAPLQGEQLDELIRRIPEIANAADGIDRDEARLAEAIQSFGAEAIPRVLALLESPRDPIREFAGYVLRGLDGLTEEHLDALIRARRRGDGWIPPAIASIGTPRAIAFLVEDLKTEPQTQTQVTGALALAGEKAAVALARSFGESPPASDEFARCVCEVLTEMEGSAAVAIDPLLEVATNEALGRMQRSLAVESLGCIGLPARRAIAALRSLAASDPGGFAASVEQAIIEIGGPEAAPLLVQRLRAAPDVFLLRDIAGLHENGRDAGPAVSEYLTHDDPDLRVGAARALGFIGYSDATAALARVAADADDWMLAYAAAESLGRLRARSAIPALARAAATHWYPPVRVAARKALDVVRGLGGYDSPTESGAFAWDFFRYEYLDVGATSIPALPPLRGGPDALSREQLGGHTYEAEIHTFGVDGEHIDRFQQEPSCGLRVENGYLLGATRGEWGGELVHVRPDAPPRRLLDENTLGVHRTPAGIVAVTGLAHLSTNRGALFLIELRPGGFYEATWWKRLPGEPRASGMLDDGRLYVGCRDGDVVITPDGRIAMAGVR